jgi:hypothetical protein
MRETCAVDLRIRLPATVVSEVEVVQRENPELLSRMVVYAVTRHTFFRHLATRSAGESLPGG